MTRQFHRPARLDPEAAESIEGTADTAASSELAHRTAQALLGGYPSEGGEPGDGQAPGSPLGNCAAGEASEEPGEWLARPDVVAAVASHGVDAVAELWADSPATTLPGALWRLFLVREWLRRDPALIARRYAVVVDLTGAGPEALARLEAALVEARPAPAPEQVRADLDRVLDGAEETGAPGLAPLLAATADFLRALAAGSDPVWIEEDADELAHRVTRRPRALPATADELDEAARRAAALALD